MANIPEANAASDSANVSSSHLVAILLLAIAFLQMPVRAATNITLGPPTMVPIPANPIYYYANDSRFPYLPNSNGTANITYWVDGANYRSEGASLDTMKPINPNNSVLSKTAGTFDNGGVWLLSVIRRNGRLYGFYHAEDHSCVPYTEWNSTALAISSDDGLTWVKQGEIIGSPNPCTGFGGNEARSIAWDAANSRWIGWGGSYGFVSTNANAAPGTWYGYHNGSFSTPMPGTGPLTSLPGLNPNPAVQGIQSVTWNSYLGQWVMVHHNWGDVVHIYYRASADGIKWSAASILVSETKGIFLNYAQIIGDTGESCGQDALLVYERSPSAARGRSRDMIERWIHWGTLTTPAAPANLTVTNEWNHQSQITLKWKATAQTQDYEVFRATSREGTYTKIGDIVTSASFPAYTDLNATAGATYYYKVQSKNAVGVSIYSSMVNAVPSRTP